MWSIRRTIYPELGRAGVGEGNCLLRAGQSWFQQAAGIVLSSCYHSGVNSHLQHQGFGQSHILRVSNNITNPHTPLLLALIPKILYPVLSWNQIFSVRKDGLTQARLNLECLSMQMRYLSQRNFTLTTPFPLSKVHIHIYVAGFPLSNYIRTAGGLWLDKEKGGRKRRRRQNEGRHEPRGFNQPLHGMIS